MKKKYLVALVCLTLTIVGVSLGNSTNNAVKKEKVIMHANYVNQKDTLDEIYAQSDLVVLGEVKESYSYKVQDMIFTNYKVDIYRTIKSKYNKYKEEIEVVLSGGSYENQEIVFDNMKPLEKGTSYLFLLNKTWTDENNNFFTPSGAYQGIIKLDKDNKKVVNNFNKDNIIEKNLIGKDIDKELKNIK